MGALLAIGVPLMDLATAAASAAATVWVAQLLSELVSDLTGRGSNDVNLIVGESESAVSVTPITEEEIGAAMIAGITEEGEDESTYTGVGVWGIMTVDEAIASALYALGICIDEDLFANDTAMAAYTVMKEAIGDCTFAEVEGVPYIVRDDHTVALPAVFVQAVIDAGIAAGVIPTTPALDVPAIPNVSGSWTSVWNRVITGANFSSEHLTEQAKTALSALKQYAEANFEIPSGVICLTSAIDFLGGLSLFSASVTITTAPQIPLTVSGWDSNTEAYFHNSGYVHVESGGIVSALPVLGYSSEGAGAARAAFEAKTYTLTCDSSYVASGSETVISVSDTGSYNLVQGLIPSIVTYYMGATTWPNEGVPMDGYGILPDAILPKQGHTWDEDFPDWGPIRVSNKDGDEVVDFIGSSVIARNPLIEGTRDLIGVVPQDVAQGGVIDIAGTRELTKAGVDTLVQDAAISDTTDALGELVDPAITLPSEASIPSTTPASFSGSGAADVGLVGLYNPTKSQLQALNQWLWTDTNIADALAKLFQSPIDAIISLCKVYAAPVSIGTGTIQCGYIASPVTGCNIVDQYTSVDCGSVFIPEAYHNILDYNPHTRVQIYLPFVGIRDLDTDEVMGSTIAVSYGVDVLTGDCLARITVTKDGSSKLLYTFPGNCAVQLPITSGERLRYFTGITPAVAGGVASAMMGNPVGVVGAAATVTNSKVPISKAGSIGGNAGVFGPRQPYVIISRPVAAEAQAYNTFYGMSSNRTVTLSTCSGFTRVKSIHLDGLDLTIGEIERLGSMLVKGVIL